jgi:hypothetical protein
VAVAAVLGRQGHDRVGQRRLVVPDAACTALRRARLTQGAARPAFGDAERTLNMANTGTAALEA